MMTKVEQLEQDRQALKSIFNRLSVEMLPKEYNAVLRSIWKIDRELEDW
tara:strand:- start:1651 stop:1797 length:147 start_codon:yes stop_codon:yes gene_type:complete